MKHLLTLLLFISTSVMADEKVLLCKMEYQDKKSSDSVKEWNYTFVIENNEVLLKSTKYGHERFTDCKFDEVMIECNPKFTSSESVKFNNQSVLKINRVTGEIYINSYWLPYENAEDGSSRKYAEMRWDSAQIGVCSDAKQKF